MTTTTFTRVMECVVVVGDDRNWCWRTWVRGSTSSGRRSIDIDHFGRRRIGGFHLSLSLSCLSLSADEPSYESLVPLLPTLYYVCMYGMETVSLTVTGERAN